MFGAISKVLQHMETCRLKTMADNCRKEWFIYTKKADFQDLGARLGVDPVLVRIMRNRDLETEDEMRLFLEGDLSDLYDPSLLPDGDRAAELIIQKIKEKRKIRIVGDYDIDGVCSAYILFDVLKNLSADVSYAIPERIRDGYGLNRRIVEEAVSDGVDTIITCDNGISAIEEIRFAKDSGLCVILTDHHDLRKDEEGSDILPAADCVVNAKRSDSATPEKEICGAVTAWKVLQLVFRKLNMSEEKWLSYLEMAALATIGDVMKLTGENRIIASEGLKQMNREIRNRGLKALIRENGLADKEIKAYHCGFIIGPCINAGGRLETAKKSMELFLADSEQEAEGKAAYLKLLNDERKDITIKGAKDAQQQVHDKFPEDKVLVVFQEDLHESLAGIVASRLKETFGRPSYVMTPSEGKIEDESGEKIPLIKGSGRSIEAYDMFRKLSECDSLLYKYGGHPMAAGVSLAADKLEAFRKKLNENCNLTEEDLIQKVWIDLEIPLSYLNIGMVEELKRLEPYGNGNERPVFACRNVSLVNRRVLGKNRNVLKMEAIDETGKRLPAIMFGEADALDEKMREKSIWNILYTPQISEFRNERYLEIKLEDIQ